MAVSGLGMLAATPIAKADNLSDQRSSEQERSDHAAKRLDEARAQMEGVDAKLAQLYIDQVQVENQIPQAQAEVDAAQAALGESERKQQAIASRLSSAERELDGLRGQIDKNESEQLRMRRSLGELVRQTYRGEGSSSAAELILAGHKTADLSELSAAAETVTRLESKSLTQVRNQIARDRTRAVRKQALTGSIANLKSEQDQLVAQAQQARDTKAAKLNELSQLKKQNDDLQQQLNSKRSEFMAQEQRAQQDYEASNRRLEQIDAKLAEQQRREREAAKARGQIYSGDQGSDRGNVDGQAVWGKPIRGRLIVASPWGYRIHPVTGTRRLHEGVDLSSPRGQQQFASRAGTVVEAYYDVGCGNMVTISHGIFAGHRWMTRHCHLSKMYVHTGQHVERGQLIGLTGATGRVTGPHVHFEIRRDGVSINPWSYINY